MPETPSRRRLLQLVAAGSVGSLAGCGSSALVDTATSPTDTTPITTDQKVPKRIYEFLVEDYRGPDNYNGLKDYTGQEEVEILVGAEGNGGHYAYSPPAIHIDLGTTVTWRWTGKGGLHQVEGTLDSTFESERTLEKGHTFSQTFDLEPPNEDGGLFFFACSQHDESHGERGAIVVGPCCGQYPNPGDEVPEN